MPAKFGTNCDPSAAIWHIQLGLVKTRVGLEALWIHVTLLQLDVTVEKLGDGEYCLELTGNQSMQALQQF